MWFCQDILGTADFAIRDPFEVAKGLGIPLDLPYPTENP